MNRNAVETFIKTYIEKLTPGSKNKQMYESFFKKMNDNQFKDWLLKLKNKQTHLMVVDASFDKSHLSIENNLKVAEELNHDFFQRLWIEEVDNNGETYRYLTLEKHLILYLPVRQPSQLLTKKLSVPEDNTKRDNLTGQVVGDSQSSGISYPELQILMGIGLDDTISELIKARGGDLGASQALDAYLNRYGNASLSTVNKYATGVESTNTLRSFLTAMHLANNL